VGRALQPAASLARPLDERIWLAPPGFAPSHSDICAISLADFVQRKAEMPFSSRTKN
jgi:hypothetical protein